MGMMNSAIQRIVIFKLFKRVQILVKSMYFVQHFRVKITSGDFKAWCHSFSCFLWQLKKLLSNFFLQPANVYVVTFCSCMDPLQLQINYKN